MTKAFFDDFDKIYTKEWKQKIQFDLKGADYNEALIHKSYEGIDIKPFYNEEDISSTSNTVSHPQTWRNSQKIIVSNAITGNKNALISIKKGAESIYFVIASEDINPIVLLSNINIDIPIYIETLFLSSTYISKINELSKTSNLLVYILTDIIGNITKTGNWYKNLKDDHLHTENLIEKSDHLKSVLRVDMGILQNAGATMIQQLAYGLAHANEYLNYFDNQSNNPFQKKAIIFTVAIGGNYFFEIAKLRALRILWTALASEYNVLNECIIIAHPSLRNKTMLVECVHHP